MRLCVWLYRLSSAFRAVRLPALSLLLDYINRILCSAGVPGTVLAGKHLVLGYGGLGVVIHGDCVLGEDVHTDQHVTLGGNGTNAGVSTIGSSVYIGVRSAVLGPISIGGNAVIGAQSVVINDVPSGSVVVGAPARVIHERIVASDFLLAQRGD